MRRETLKALWKKYWMWIPLALVLAYLFSAGIAFTHLSLNFHRANAVSKPIDEAVRRQYPGLRFEVKPSAEEPPLRVHIFGVKDEAMQSEIRDWLGNLKSQVAPNLSLWIYWDKEDGSRDPYSEPSKL
jgi:hypothetical protein